MPGKLKDDVVCPICGKDVVSVARVPGPGIVFAHYLHDGDVGRPRSLHTAWYTLAESKAILESEQEVSLIVSSKEVIL